MKTSAKKIRAGFTLVELLVATMLLTIVMTAVYTLFFTVIQSWRSIEQDHGYHRKARNVLSLLQREYNNAYYAAGHLMEGDAHDLTLFLLASPMQQDEKTGPQLLRVHYHFNASAGELEREEALVEAALPGQIEDTDQFDRAQIAVARPYRTIVARNLRDVDFRYVWMPRPDGNYWRNAPTTVTPLRARYHRLGWGFPQALDIQLQYPGEDDAPPFVADIRLLTPTDTYRREVYQLENILGDAL